MAQPDYIEINATPARRAVKRAIRELEDANKELARLESRVKELERLLAAEYGISIIGGTQT